MSTRTKIPKIEDERESVIWRQALDTYMRSPGRIHESPEVTGRSAVLYADFVLLAYRKRAGDLYAPKNF